MVARNALERHRVAKKNRMKPIPLGYAKVKTRYGFVRKGDVPPGFGLESPSDNDGDEGGGSGDDDGDEKEPEPDEATGYPELYLHDAPDALLDLPKEGKATIEFKVASRTSTERKGDDGKTETCVDVSLEIVSITPEGGKDEPLKQSPRDAFSRWSKEKG